MIGLDRFGIDLVVRVRASPETVFKFFTDATQYRRWMGDDAELDPRPGGLYRVRFPGRPTAEGRYLVVSPPDRVVFTWGWVGSADVPPGSTTVEVDFTREGEETVVRVVHRGLPSDADRAQHAEGWEQYLRRLSQVAGGVDPGPDPAVADTGPGSAAQQEEYGKP